MSAPMAQVVPLPQVRRDHDSLIRLAVSDLEQAKVAACGDRNTAATRLALFQAQEALAVAKRNKRIDGIRPERTSLDDICEQAVRLEASIVAWGRVYRDPETVEVLGWLLTSLGEFAANVADVPEDARVATPEDLADRRNKLARETR